MGFGSGRGVESSPMDLKRLVTQFAYHIEPKPEGGFVARASDPSIPPLEAPTREELQKKIQERIFAGLAQEFPGLKLSADGTQRQFAFHVERKPGGGFEIHSSDPNVEVIHAATEHDLQSHLLEKVLNLAGQRLMPELAKAIAPNGLSGDIKVVVNRKTAVTFNAGSRGMTFALTKDSAQPGATQSSVQAAPLASAAPTPDFTNLNPGDDASPIIPEPSNFGRVVRIALAAALVVAIVYFFVLHR